MAAIRPAQAGDLPKILDILNREIEQGYAHFGTEPMSPADLESEFHDRAPHPWLVAIEGDVAGFAKASAWKNRGGYKKTCETGIYVLPEFKRRGIARALYQSLLKELEKADFHTILAGIALPNEASVVLHESLGFRHVGTLPEVGWKLGAWRDVGYWAITL